MNYEVIIGLEVHVQLHTKSKMFCRCSADYANAVANTHVCPVCLGMPGVLPTINQQAVEYTIMTALALNCTIAEYTKFDRKNYPYPDLMKGYQISQYDAPIGYQGWLNIEADGREKRVGITRVHLEEDVAKLIHHNSDREAYSLVDVNRSGVPLMEVVGEPDLRSPEEARQYLMKLHGIMQYLGVSTANMEEGSFRCDANISIRPEGSPQSLAKVEVKNMNSFRAVYRALEYEAKRQPKAAEAGERLIQETRGWVEDKGVKGMADYFEEICQVNKEIPAKIISSWFGGPVSRILNANNIYISEFRKRVSPEQFVKLLVLETQASTTLTTAKYVLEQVFNTGKDPADIIDEQGLTQINDTGQIEEAVSQVIAANAQAVADFRSGKETALKFLVGQVMRLTGGRANPQMVNELLKKKLGEE
ncbi:MAG: Asp-tRNA(Asn)/Glu-tRNA(Gln) amidotransferase subunit GatB [Chloroflexi bacterium]|nr:Asp-tRNA(Asn)/Glu-tRNA(Gln) amidotransferase subunit GatB [Chloroflexota bacterium]